MDLRGSVDKILKIAALTGVVLTLACLQALPANSAPLFNEKWQQQNQCKNTGGGGGKTCMVVSGGNFNIQTTFLGTTCAPSDIQPGAGEDLNISLGGGTSGSGSDSTGGYTFSDPDVGDDFSIKVSGNKTVATGKLIVQKCNPPVTNCPQVSFEKVKVTVNSNGDLTLNVNAQTGKNFNGDVFENSIDALNFVGLPSGPITDTVTLNVSLGSCFSSGDVTVDVTGNVKTTTPKTGSTKPALSTVKIKGN